MLADVIDHLVCPVCRAGLALGDRLVRCDRGHSFDVARQGYVNLLTGSTTPGTADTTAMVTARAEFLAAGHYTPLAGRLAELCAAAVPSSPSIIADAGAGTGHYLTHALARTGRETAGIALDVSKHALRRAARAHPRIGAVVADVWRPLPIRDESVDVLLNVFAPRNPQEFARVLKPRGMMLIVTPGSGHLGPLVERLGLLSVAEDKELRLEETLDGRFTKAVQEVMEITLTLGHKEVEAVAGMGPSAWHADPDELAVKIRGLPDPMSVRASFHITGWRKPASPGGESHAR